MITKSQTIKHGAVATLIFLALLYCLPGTTWGHSFPDHSDPKVGATVNGSPSHVRIWFDGALEPAFCTLSVQDSGGKKVDKGDGRVSPADATLLEVGISSLPPGTYRAVWNVVARDGHRTMGDFTFVIK